MFVYNSCFHPVETLRSYGPLIFQIKKIAVSNIYCKIPSKVEFIAEST